jgi:hypothetical protein
MMRRPRDLPARPAAAAALALVLTALTVGTAGCIASVEDVPWVDTQRYPKPMNPRADLPPGSAELYAPGPEVVLVHLEHTPYEDAGLLSVALGALAEIDGAS